MAHYAISELLIVLAALWGAKRLVGQDRATAAFGLLLFGAAAAIGVVRFPFGLIVPWADMHRFAGTMGGLLGMMALGHQILRSENLRLTPGVHMALAALGLGLGSPCRSFGCHYSSFGRLGSFGWPLAIPPTAKHRLG